MLKEQTCQYKVICRKDVYIANQRYQVFHHKTLWLLFYIYYVLNCSNATTVMVTPLTRNAADRLCAFHCFPDSESGWANVGHRWKHQSTLFYPNAIECHVNYMPENVINSMAVSWLCISSRYQLAWEWVNYGKINTRMDMNNMTNTQILSVNLAVSVFNTGKGLEGPFLHGISSKISSTYTVWVCQPHDKHSFVLVAI